MTTSTSYPLILTLQLEAAAQNLFNDLRKQHFPAKINHLDAHLTLFHNLPNGEPVITTQIAEIAAVTDLLTLSVNRIVSTGNGTAYKIENTILAAMHHHLQKKWQQWLIPQDKQKLWPHITVQNKVSAGAAKELQHTLQRDFTPFEITATGLSLWEYLGGPWQFVKTYPFEGKPGLV